MSASQYLSRYAEPEAQLADVLDLHCQHVVTIPVRDEPLQWFEQISTFLRASPGALAIVVINQPARQPPSDANHALYQRFVQAGTALAWPPHAPADQQAAPADAATVGPHQPAAVLCRFGASHALVLDRYQHRQIAPKEGVGKARKIAADIALALHQAGRLNSGWVHCTDADVRLPAAYFELPAAASEVAAMLYPFHHVVAAQQSADCIRLYEQRLQYYVDGLRWAGSGYAYHSVGSTLAINLLHYARVRGFPRRAAGEDFHLLNKLAKTGEIVSLAAPCLPITHRCSERVPFGTGQAVKQLEAARCPYDVALFEHPGAFTALREVLAMSDELWRCQDAERAWARASRLPSASVAALSELGFAASLAHAFSQSRDRAQWMRHLHTRFDALATLRFLHLLAREQFPNLSWHQLQRQPPPFSQIFG